MPAATAERMVEEATVAAVVVALAAERLVV
jgi:hypothetical protein